MAKYFLTKDLLLRASTGLLSLRPGGTSAEASNSITCRLISKGGRWRIDNTLNGYIEEIIKDRLSVTKISILYNQGYESRVTNEPKKTGPYTPQKILFVLCCLCFSNLD